MNVLPPSLSFVRVAVVVGLGLSGVSAARALLRLGIQVRVNDQRSIAQLSETAHEISSMGGELHLGGHPISLVEGADLIIASPGVPPENPVLAAGRRRGIPVWGEMELGLQLLRGVPLVAITGTNGKSTTTTWAGSMVAAALPRVFVGGNLGTPLCAASASQQGGPWDCLVVEVSSFQAQTSPSAHPLAAAVLNVTPDHLDRYAGMEEYAAAKGELFRLQVPGDLAVYRSGDFWAEKVARTGKGELAPFASRPLQKGEIGGGISSDSMQICLPGGQFEEYPLQDFTVPGTHNRENLMAATLLARRAGVSPEEIMVTLPRLGSLPHRLEPVGVRRGVTFYNDSKATNVDSAAASVGGLPGPLVWLLGGKHKGSPYTPLRALVPGRVRAVVAFGAAGGRVREDMEGAGCPVVQVGTLSAAVEEAAGLALAGDAVVLSPACSSYDEFNNFEERGARFRSLVEALS